MNPTEQEIMGVLQTFHYNAFRKTMSFNAASGMAHELLVKGQSAPQYVVDGVNHMLERAAVRGGKLNHIEMWLTSIIKRK
jgi:hypothetical protein